MVRIPTFASEDKRAEVIEEKLNRLGMEGWELTSVSQIATIIRLYLKKSY